ncbi:MAG: hypothetical protein KC645_08880, partial [Gemmatimonadetes bacterium]|nr:hypothetical protein [Gemmatimonadota bacterium]
MSELRRLLPAAVVLLSSLSVPAAAAQDAAVLRARHDSTAKDPLPLQPGRTLDLDLTEGSWISVDVSPDGRTLVFDYLGDLYTLPIEGGTATRITSGM